MKTTHIQVRRFVFKPYFSTQSPSVHFYSLAPMRNNCLYALPVLLLVLLLSVSGST
jgi:hypothetical protein